MTLDINELERLHAEAVEHTAQMTAAPSYWRHTPAGQAALNAVVEHFPEIVARLKAAEEMREALGAIADANENALLGSLKDEDVGHAETCAPAQSDTLISALAHVAKAIAAYDKAKG